MNKSMCIINMMYPSTPSEFREQQGLLNESSLPTINNSWRDSSNPSQYKTELGVPAAWKHLFSHATDALSKVQSFLHQELTMYGDHLQIFPSRNNIFHALKAVGTPDNVRVVIIGQDPYIRPNQATGLAFGVPNDTKPLPPSLRNIFLKLREDVSGKSNTPISSDLVAWANQGVLLLNTALTVREGQSNSHSMPWKAIIHEFIRTFAKCKHEKGEKMIFLLWGGHAISIQKIANLNNTIHEFICSSHPSPLSCRRGVQGYPAFAAEDFNCFVECNQQLVERGETPIKWI